MTLEQDGGMAASAVAGLLCLYRMWPLYAPTDGEPRCGGCGYIVRGLPGPICPECGSDLRRVPVVCGDGKRRGPVLSLLWTGFVILTVFIPGHMFWQEKIKPQLPNLYLFDDKRVFAQPVSGAYADVRLVIHGSGFGTPRVTDVRLELTRARGAVREMEVEPGSLAYRYEASTGRTISQPSGMDAGVIVAWFADAGIRPTEEVREEARVVMAAIRAVIDPDTLRLSSGLGGVFRAGGIGSSASSGTPLWYDLVPAVIAILVWLWPVLDRQWLRRAGFFRSAAYAGGN